MYLVYLDESGSPEQSDRSNWYVLSALIIHETYKFDIISDVCELKRKYFPNYNPIDVEFHMKDLAHHYGIFKPLGLECERKLIEDIGKLIRHSNCNLITVAIDKRFFTEKMKNILELAMELMFKHIQLFLNRENEKTKDRPQFGILIMDSINGTVDNKIRKQIKDLSTHCAKDSRDYFINQPIFVKSCEDHIIQLADYVSYCMRRCFMFSEDKNDANRRMYMSITDGLSCKFFETECLNYSQSLEK